VIATYGRTAGETVASSPYTISAKLNPSGVLGNYNVADNTGTFSIATAPLAAAANSASMTYGTALPVFSGTLDGVLNNDGITATYATTATPVSSAGRYAISPSLSDPQAKLGNYSAVFTDGTLTINKAASILTLQTSAPAVLLKNDLALTARASSSTGGMPTGR